MKPLRELRGQYPHNPVKIQGLFFTTSPTLISRNWLQLRILQSDLFTKGNVSGGTGLSANYSARSAACITNEPHYPRTKNALPGSPRERQNQHTPPRDPYVFEFLGLKPHEALTEQTLENLLLDRLEEFLLELGRGFCFEARQKRILIGGEHFFVDLVFYHRILKCHVLIELKVDSFSHEYLGQLNTYVNWFRLHEMADDDNPPVGILLCTKKNEALVEYALAGMDNQLFVSKYQLGLPGKEEIRRFIEEQIRGEGEETE